MGLEVNYDAVKDQTKVWVPGIRPGTKESGPVATVVSVETLAIGMPSLSTASIDTFYLRSVKMALVRGSGPWVLKKGKPISSTYVTYEQLEDMIGMTTNAPKLSTEEFDRKCLEELQRTGDRLLMRAKGPKKYLVSVRVERLKPAVQLDPADRKALFGVAPGAVRSFDYTIDRTKGMLPADVEAAAIEEFHLTNFRGIKRKGDFEVTVTKSKLLEDD